MLTQLTSQTGGRQRRQELVSSAAAITGIDTLRELCLSDAEEDLTPEIDRQSVRLLVVDDEPINVEVVSAYLEDAGYTNIVSFTDSVAALIALEQESFDVALLDLMMPRVSGLDLLKQMRESRRLRHLPAVVLTASTDRAAKRRAIELGASDFLNKPFDPEELLSRTYNGLLRKAHHDRMQSYSRDLIQQVERRTAELVSSQIQLVYCLGRAAEYRDNDTGRHVVRVGRFSGLIADELGMGTVASQQIELAATLHDIGKLGVPDSILLKPAKLTPAEMSVMKQHAELGCSILSPQYSSIQHVYEETGIENELANSFEAPLLKLAATIAITHHERWDGTGYPNGLQGDDIPLAGRIVAIADVFDALSTVRPYKQAIPFDECVEMIRRESGTHFDPEIVDAFLQRLPEIKLIASRFRDRGVTE